MENKIEKTTETAVTTKSVSKKQVEELRLQVLRTRVRGGRAAALESSAAFPW